MNPVITVSAVLIALGMFAIYRAGRNHSPLQTFVRFIGLLSVWAGGNLRLLLALTLSKLMTVLTQTSTGNPVADPSIARRWQRG